MCAMNTSDTVKPARLRPAGGRTTRNLGRGVIAAASIEDIEGLADRFHCVRARNRRPIGGRQDFDGAGDYILLGLQLARRVGFAGGFAFDKSRAPAKCLSGPRWIRALAGALAPRASVITRLPCLSILLHSPH